MSVSAALVECRDSFFEGVDSAVISDASGMSVKSASSSAWPVFEAPAAGTDQGDFIDDQGREIDTLRLG